jgi:hypothetical protein
MSYSIQRKSAADLLAWCQAHVDPTATAVDAGTGQVTTSASWNEMQKADWTVYWSGPGSMEVVQA